MFCYNVVCNVSFTAKKVSGSWTSAWLPLGHGTGCKPSSNLSWQYDIKTLGLSTVKWDNRMIKFSFWQRSGDLIKARVKRLKCTGFCIRWKQIAFCYVCYWRTEKTHFQAIVTAITIHCHSSKPLCLLQRPSRDVVRIIIPPSFRFLRWWSYFPQFARNKLCLWISILVQICWYRRLPTGLPIIRVHIL